MTNTPELHDAHVQCEFTHWLENLPYATWASDAPRLPAPRKPKGSKLLLALVARAVYVAPVYAGDFDFDLESFVDF